MSGELVVRVHPTGVQDGMARSVPWGPDTLAGSAFMRYVGPLTGADRAEHYVALARLERRQQRVAAAMGSAGQLIKTQYLTVPTILLAFAPVLMMSSPVGREQQCSSNAQAPLGSFDLALSRLLLQRRF